MAGWHHLSGIENIFIDVSVISQTWMSTASVVKDKPTVKCNSWMCLYYLMAGGAFRNVTCLVYLKNAHLLTADIFLIKMKFSLLVETIYERILVLIFVCDSEKDAFILILRIIIDFNFLLQILCCNPNTSLTLQSNMKSIIALRVMCT